MPTNYSIRPFSTQLSLSLQISSGKTGYRTVRDNKRVKFKIFDEYTWGSKVSPEFAAELLHFSTELFLHRDNKVILSTLRFQQYHQSVCYFDNSNLNNEEEGNHFYFDVVQARHMYKIHNNIPQWYDNDGKQCNQMLYDSNQTWLESNQWSTIIRNKYPDLCECVWNGIGLSSCPREAYYSGIPQERLDTMAKPVQIHPNLKFWKERDQVSNYEPLWELAPGFISESVQALSSESETNYEQESEVQHNQILLDPTQQSEGRYLSPKTTGYIRGDRIIVPSDASDHPVQMARVQMESSAREDFANDMVAEAQLLSEARVMQQTLAGEFSSTNFEDMDFNSEEINTENTNPREAPENQLILPLRGGQPYGSENIEMQERELEDMEDIDDDDDEGYEGDMDE